MYLISADFLIIMYLIALAMKPPKRGITKPARYQTTESSADDDEVLNINYELTKDEVHKEVESDIQALSKVFVETQHVLDKEDDDNKSLLNRNQLPTKPSVRSNIILDPPLKSLKALSSYHNKPTISNQYDIMSHSNVSYNDYDVASTSSTVNSDAQYEPTNLKLVSSYQSETCRKDELRTIKCEKNVDNQRYDYLNNKR
jgi:hypothetical protein